MSPLPPVANHSCAVYSAVNLLRCRLWDNYIGKGLVWHVYYSIVVSVNHVIDKEGGRASYFLKTWNRWNSFLQTDRKMDLYSIIHTYVASLVFAIIILYVWMFSSPAAVFNLYLLLRHFFLSHSRCYICYIMDVVDREFVFSIFIVLLYFYLSYCTIFWCASAQSVLLRGPTFWRAVGVHFVSISLVPSCCSLACECGPRRSDAVSPVALQGAALSFIGKDWIKSVPSRTV